ncbi:metal ABC transporter ATP-binding protein [Candidatus Bathyarchaeota archaeon]|nr:MAG: metal ABC transporter ATP-binding protein [Candidatus Bathyarchaeota archaeon]
MRVELVAEGLTAGYDGEVVISDMDFSLRGPGLVQVLGPNGSGKTTLLKALIGLLRPLRGRVLVNGEDITGRPEEASTYVGYVPQAFAPEQHYPMTVWELVVGSYVFHRRGWPRLRLDGRCREAVRKALDLVDLPPGTWHRSIWELSGGQRQRALIARALVHDPPILMMDEPLSPVDPLGRVELAKHIGQLAEHKLVIVTSHDPTLLLPYTKTVLLLNRAFYVIGEPSEVLTLENLREVYGEAAIKVEEYIHICDACR